MKKILLFLGIFAWLASGFAGVVHDKRKRGFDITLYDAPIIIAGSVTGPIFSFPEIGRYLRLDEVVLFEAR